MKRFSTNLQLHSMLLAIALLTFGITYSWHRAQKPSSVGDDSDVFERMLPHLKVATILNADTAWLINIKSGDLMRTDDGGQHWLKTSAEIVGGRFFAAWFNNARQGWAVGSEGTVWHSFDGGESWTLISKLGEADPNQWSFVSAGKIQFIDDNVGWILEPFGVWRSADGGKSWRRVRGGSKPGGPVAGIFGDQTAVVAFSNGDVYSTSDGCRSWNSVEVIKDGNIRHLDGLDSQFSWLVGYGPPSYDSRVSYSHDGGKMWRNSGEIPYKGSIYFVQFLNQEEGWAVGAIPAGTRAGQQDPIGLVLHTNTAGKTWQQLTAPRGENFFEAIHFADPQRGWLLARNSLYRTNDAGMSWSIVFKVD